MGYIKDYLIIYYGEHGSYPRGRFFRAYVIGQTWNDLEEGALEGQYYTDDSYKYYCWDGVNYFIVSEKKPPNALTRTLDQDGVFENWPAGSF